MVRRRDVRLPCGPRGAAVVELAIIAPLFIVLVLGMVEFARMVMVQQALTNATREGARKAALTTTTNSSDVDATVRNHLSTSLVNASDPKTCRVAITPSDMAGIAENTEIVVSAEVDYSDVTWLPASFLGGAVLKGAAKVRRE